MEIQKDTHAPIEGRKFVDGYCNGFREEIAVVSSIRFMQSVRVAGYLADGYICSQSDPNSLPIFIIYAGILTKNKFGLVISYRVIATDGEQWFLVRKITGKNQREKLWVPPLMQLSHHDQESLKHFIAMRIGSV